MRIKLKYPDLETFIQKYAVNISRGGIFIATRQPKPVGTVVKFEFLLANAEQTSLIRGEGVVQWNREYDPATPTKAHGMGLKFTRLDAESQLVVDRALAYRQSHGMVKKGDSEGITVSATAPAGATPEPMALNREEDAPTGFHGAPAPRREDKLRYRQEDPPTRNTKLPAPDEELPTHRSLPNLEPTERLETERSLPNVDDRTLHALEDARGDSTVLARTVRGDPTVLERPPITSSGRAPDQHTREVSLPPEDAGRRLDSETKPISLPDPPGGDTTGEVQLPGAAPQMIAQSMDDSVRIALERHRQPRNGRKHGDELDQLISDWNMSIERVEKLIRKKRPRMGAQATAELERLMRKPPKPPSVSKAEAIQLLEALLSGKSETATAPMPPPPASEPATQAQAAGGEPEPEATPKGRRKRAR